MYDLNARYYDAKIARFLSPDPYYDLGNRVIGLYEINVPNAWSIIQANALYVYCGNSPVTLFDPSGLIVTVWDKQHLTQSEIETLEHYTKDWDDANKVGDEYGMYRAHANAEDIRRKYRDINEITLGNGLTGTVFLDEDYNRIFTYIEREKVSKSNKSFTSGEVVLAIILFPVVALSSCNHTDTKEFEKQLKMSGNYTGTDGLPSNVVNSFQQYETNGWKNHAGQTPSTRAGGGLEKLRQYITNL